MCALGEDTEWLLARQENTASLRWFLELELVFKYANEISELYNTPDENKREKTPNEIKKFCLRIGMAQT